jgi:CheY-like chemotaxis protein
MDSTAGRVLYLEDEELVAEVGRKMLEIIGFSVDVCATGEEALALFTKAHESPSPYAFAILDIVIKKGMGGIETLQKIHGIDRNFKAIATSGYAYGDFTGEYSKNGFSAYLSKPFLIHDIKKAVEAVLGSGK